MFAERWQSINPSVTPRHLLMFALGQRACPANQTTPKPFPYQSNEVLSNWLPEALSGSSTCLFDKCHGSAALTKSLWKPDSRHRKAQYGH